MSKVLNDSEFILLVAESVSLADVIRGLDLLVAGANYETVKKRISRLDLDISHFLGQGWNKENWSGKGVGRASLKARLIREKGHVCQSCNNSESLGEPITLELEHIDGNTRNNENDNLLLLCPNCHSQTPTWRRHKNAKTSLALSQVCPGCGNKKYYRAAFCRKCYNEQRAIPVKLSVKLPVKVPKSKVCPECGEEPMNVGSLKCVKCTKRQSERTIWPSVDELIVEIEASNFLKVANRLGVSDNAIRHRLRARGYDPKSLMLADSVFKVD